jgi:hypothetical protein
MIKYLEIRTWIETDKEMDENILFIKIEKQKYKGHDFFVLKNGSGNNRFSVNKSNVTLQSDLHPELIIDSFGSGQNRLFLKGSISDKNETIIKKRFRNFRNLAQIINIKNNILIAVNEYNKTMNENLPRKKR